MLTEKPSQQLKLHCITLEELVPQEHFLRKLDALVDFSFVYDEVRELYCKNNGRPSIDPVVLVKYLLVGYLYGIESERRIEQEIQVNMAYRWFLGIDLGKRVPDHSTISQNRRRRFNGSLLIRRIFEHILSECIEKGLVDGEIILTDSTHVRANSSVKANKKVVVQRKASEYMKRLDYYEELERTKLEEARTIKPKRSSNPVDKSIDKVEKTVSTTDPDAGMLSRPGKPRAMHYLSHQSVDAKHGIVVDVTATAGNVNDAEPYLKRIEHIREHLGLNIKSAVADASYGTSLIYQTMEDMGIQLYTPKPTQNTAYKVEFAREDFVYDKLRDYFICPMKKELTLHSLERQKSCIYRVYRAKPKDCRECPMLDSCVSKSHKSRSIHINIFENTVAKQRKKDDSSTHKQMLKLRQIWCEGSFAAQKWSHNLKRLFRRGIEAAEEHCLLSATALNLKRMVRCLG